MEQFELHDLDYTHRFINYIQASFQGRFAMLNIFSRTGHPLFRDEEMQKTQKILKELHSWEREMYAGRLRFPINNHNNPTDEHKKAFEYLNAITPELESLAKKIKGIITSQSMNSEPDDAFLLLATFGRNAYCRDNYVRGFVRFGEHTNDQSIVDNYNEYLEEAKNNIETTNELLTNLQKNEGTLGPTDIEFIAFICRTLSGVFRSHIHDIKQLLAGPTDEFTFRKAGFLQAEAEAWASAGYNPIEAGYWRAHELGIDDASYWKSHDIVDPSHAADWKTAGFPAEVAVTWIQVLFAPIVAIQWANYGYNPREAAILVMSGFQHPSEIPADQVQDLLAEGFQRLEKQSGELDKVANG